MENTDDYSYNQQPVNNNDVRDLLFENSPLDQYLQSLNLKENEDNRGEVLSFEMFNQENIENNEEYNQIKYDNNNNENNNDNKNNNSNNTFKNNKNKNNNIKLNKIQIFFMSLYQSISSIIIESDILLVQESPFIQNPNLSLKDNDNDNDDDESPLPPIYPLSLYTLDNDNISNNNKELSLNIIELISILYNKNNNNNNNYIIILISILILIISIFLNFKLIIFIFSISVIAIILILKIINSKIKETQRNIKSLEKVNLELIDACKNHYNQISKTIQLIREVELISRGYRLSTPVTPIERIEQSNNNNSGNGTGNSHKSEKSFILRASVSKSLKTFIILFKNLIENQAISLNLLENQKQFIKCQLSELFNSNNNNNNNNNNIDDINTKENQEEIELDQLENDSQLPIVTLKLMLHQYEFMVSNFFTLFIISISNLLNNNNNFNRSGDVITTSNIFNFSNINNNICQFQLILLKISNRLTIENNSIKSLISKELWENKIPKRVILSKPKKTTIESFIYNTNQIAESLNSISPLFTSLLEKIVPLKQNNNQNNNDNNNSDYESSSSSSITILDILKLDEVVNDFLLIKNELTNSLKNWDNANRSLVKMVRTIPTTNPNLQKEWTEQEATEKLKKLLEKLRSNHFNNNDDHDDHDDDDPNNQRRQKQNELNKLMTSTTTINENQWLIYEDTGDLDPTYIERPLIQINDNNNNNNENTNSEPPNSNNETTTTTTTTTIIITKPPPPPPPMGLPRRTKPPKRTMYDPDFDPITQKMRVSPETSTQNNNNKNSIAASIIPQKKLMNELKTVLDIHVLKKNMPT
ncbi:hypothetical protein ACTFIW_004455 [Dictyostelium discoideum]